jgi:DNA-binding MarR family transcriptional regulator
MKTAAAVHDPKTAEIADALLAMARVMNQVRAHENLCRHAGVELDRGGAALLYKLFADGEDVRITELAERLGIDPPAVTRKVQQLERSGLLSRAADPEDARACRLRLSEEGRTSIERLLRAREEWIDSMLDGWPEADKREFARLLTLFASTIAADIEVIGGR